MRKRYILHWLSDANRTCDGFCTVEELPPAPPKRVCHDGRGKWPRTEAHRQLYRERMKRTRQLQLQAAA